MDHNNSQGKTRHNSEEYERNAAWERREKNRQAAQRCRQNREKKTQELKQENEALAEDNKKLADEKRKLKKDALTGKRLIEEHCQKGCKIADGLMIFWNDMINIMAEEKDSDEDSDEKNKSSAQVLADKHAPSRSPPNATEALQQLQTAIHDPVDHQFEAPIALFSGKPLHCLQATRNSSNSSSKPASSFSVSIAPVPLTKTSSSKPSHVSTLQESAGLPSPLAQISTLSTNGVQKQVDITAAPPSAANNTPRTMSNMNCYLNNDRDLFIKLQDIMQARNINALPVIQPMPEMGTPPSPSDDSVKSVERMLNACLNPITGYTYLEDLLTTAEDAQNGNDKIQGLEVTRTDRCSQFQGQSESEATVPFDTFDTMTSAEMSPSPLQQTKASLGSLPNQDAEIEDNDVIFLEQNITYPNVTMASQAEEQSMPNRNQFQPKVLKQCSVTARRQGGKENRMSTRETQNAYDKLSHITLGISVNNSIQATVLSSEQLIMLKQKQKLSENPRSGCSPAWKKSTSHQQAVQLPQQVTCSFPGLSGDSSKTHNNANDAFARTLYTTKPQPLAHPNAQKNTIAIDELSVREVTDDNNTDKQQPVIRTPVFQLVNPHQNNRNHKSVEQTKIKDILMRNSATSDNSVYSSTPIRLNTPTRQFCPQVNKTISTNGDISKDASNKASDMCSSSACNMSTKLDVQKHNFTTPVMTSRGHQHLKIASQTLPPKNLSQGVEISKTLIGHPRNTEASCSSTDIADQVFIPRTPEALLQPKVTISGMNFLIQQGRVVTPDNCLSMSTTDEPENGYENIISLPEDIDYLSESPQGSSQFSY